MRKILIGALLSSLFQIGFTEESMLDSNETVSANAGNRNHTRRFLIEVNSEYYWFINSTTRDVMGAAALTSLEACIKLYKGFNLWLGGSYLKTQGSSIGESSRTTLEMIPIFAGFKNYFYTHPQIYPYIGLGFVSTWSEIGNSYDYVQSKISDWDYGIKAQVGTNFYPIKDFFIDLFINYNYLQVDYPESFSPTIYRSKAKLSGLGFGGGIGYEF